MKRKKWSELEEQTLLTKYSHLHASGTLAKLKTREKKFKPIADHVNSLHHLQDPINFPFKWSWRDVSIKVQNMRHQYMGVKQKIRVSDGHYNWKDGENHWENFMKYKEVFGDIELESRDTKRFSDVFGGDEFFGLGFEELQNEEEEEDDDDDNGELGNGDDVGAGSDTELGFEKGDKEESDDLGSVRVKKLRKGGRMLGLVGAQMVELRDVVMRREEKRREREWRREEGVLEREEKKREREFRAEKEGIKRDKEAKIRELEFEERVTVRAKREIDERKRLEMEFDEERRRRMVTEERWEEEEMKWREKMVSMQMEHEKQMMQLHANACQNQMQILGVMARLFCQFFGSANDGLSGLGPHVLQHPGGLDDDRKPDGNSPSEFL